MCAYFLPTVKGIGSFYVLIPFVCFPLFLPSIQKTPFVEPSARWLDLKKAAKFDDKLESEIEDAQFKYNFPCL